MLQPEITRLLAIISTEYPRHFEVSKERIRLWGMILNHASYEEASKAVAAVLGEARPFPPQVGEINQQILKARLEDKSHQYRLKEEARLKALPPPEPILDPESRDRCVKMLQDCVAKIAAKKVMPS